MKNSLVGGTVVAGLLIPVAGSEASLVVSRDFIVNQNLPEGGELANIEQVDFGAATIANVAVRLTLSGQSGPMANSDWYAGIGYDQGGYAVLLNRVGKSDSERLGYLDNGFDVVFRDEGFDIHRYREQVGELGLAPLTGEWAPDGRGTSPGEVTAADPRTELLESFRGHAAAGEWRLLLSQESLGGAAKIDKWGLELELDPIAGQTMHFSDGDRLRAAGPEVSVVSDFSMTGSVTFDGNDRIELNGALRGNGTLRREGGGELVLSENADFLGEIEVTNGSLRIANGSGSATGAATVRVSDNGLLLGNGIIGGPVTIENGGILAPGSSPGTLTVASAEWGSGGIYELEMKQAGGTAGQDFGWDLFVVEETLLVTATEADPFVISLVSLGLDDAPGALGDFNPTQTDQWLIATAETITGFSLGSLALDIAPFETFHLLPEGWGFALASHDNDLYLQYIPEPRAWGLFLGLAGFVMIVLRKRLRKRE